MALTYYVPVCVYCGKKDNGSGKGLSGGSAPGSSPRPMSGRCPSSPDGKHAPRWEIDYSRK